MDKNLLNAAEATRKKLDEVSPSFCLAKWTMATIHLLQGETHSCYHPHTHKVPINELQNNVSSLHNTEFKKSQRKLMLQGQRPSECQYCWNIEDLNQNMISDRIIRSSEPWSDLDFEKISQMTGDENINPRHLEISFDNVCQLKCIYCNPTVSSKWWEEIKEFGGYKTSCGFNDYTVSTGSAHDQEKAVNPYAEAFWKWWPDLKNDLLVFRITGGEPLLSKETFKVLDNLIEFPNPKLELLINSNLSVPEALIDKLIISLKTLTEKGCIKSVTIFGSIDTFGDQAEYIRTGLNFKKFVQNVEKILAEVPKSQISFTVTYNALSVPGFLNLLKLILELRKKHNRVGTPNRMMFDTPYLRYPNYLSIQVLPESFLKYLDEQIQFVSENIGGLNGFTSLEHAKLLRLRLWMKKSVEPEILTTQLNDFLIYFQEHDRRRKTDFLKTFPEFSNFFNGILNASDIKESKNYE